MKATFNDLRHQYQWNQFYIMNTMDRFSACYSGSALYIRVFVIVVIATRLSMT